MEKYIGVKLISAEPQIEGGFSTAGQHGGIIAREGYKVVYEDGYKSWSPKDAFEKAYIKVKPFPSIEETARPPHQQRVIDEMYDLEEKRLKLNAFIGGSEIFTKLDLDEQSRLKQQSLVMQAYVTILIERIENFK